MSTSSSDSILNTIKKMLGLDPEYDAFDQELVVFINTALSNLHQIGVGPDYGFMINGSEESWSELLPAEVTPSIQNVKSYIYITVKMLFDPPGATNHSNALSESLKELTWRISVKREEDRHDSGTIEIITSS